MKIRAKIRLVMSVTLLASLLVVGVATVALNYVSTMRTLEQTMMETVEIASDRVSKELEVYKQIACEVGSVARLASEENTTASKKEIIDQRAAVHSLQRGNIIGLDGISIFDGKDYSDRAYYQASLKGEPYISTPLVSKITGQLSIMISAPLWEGGIPNTRVAGVVYFVPKETFLNDIAATIQVGQRGGCYILDKSGNVIASENMDDVKNQVNVQALAQSDPSLTQLAGLEAKMTRGETGFGQCTRNGTSTILAYSPIAGTDGWSLAVYADRVEMTASIIQSVVITLLILLLAVTAASFIAGKLAKGISRPINACVQRMEALVEGDLKTPVPESTAKDESGQLLRAVRTLTDCLNELIGDVDYLLSGMSNRDLKVRSRCEERYVGDFGSLLHSVERLGRDLSETMRGVGQAADQVSAGSDQISSGAQALAQGATEQASSIQELAAAIGEISQQVDATAEHAGVAKTETAAVGREMEVCTGHMEALVAAMRTIEEKSEEISKVNKVIGDIAFQTNILALNAAVEAARAGEAGKGFAVVADEVRNLAGKSADAAQNTTKLVQETVGAIEQGAALTREADGSLQQVSASAQRVLEVVALIDRASAEQAQAVAQVTQGVDQISSVVQTNSATAEESAAASEELSGQASALKEEVGRFTLREE